MRVENEVHVEDYITVGVNDGCDARVDGPPSVLAAGNEIGVWHKGRRPLSSL